MILSQSCAWSLKWLAMGVLMLHIAGTETVDPGMNVTFACHAMTLQTHPACVHTDQVEYYAAGHPIEQQLHEARCCMYAKFP
jgi:hypothetical protein